MLHNPCRKSDARHVADALGPQPGTVHQNFDFAKFAFNLLLHFSNRCFVTNIPRNANTAYAMSLNRLDNFAEIGRLAIFCRVTPT